MTTKVKLEKIIGFKSGRTSNGKDWQSLEVMVTYEAYGKILDVLLSFNGKADIVKVEKYSIGTIFNTEMIPKTTMYESGKSYTVVYGWGSFTEQNIENYNDARSKEIDNPFATQQ